MRRRQQLRILVLAVALSCALAGACKTRSAWDKVLSERARWTVLALDWTQGRDNVVMLSTRLSGPPNSPLKTLTVRIVLTDAGGATIEEVWHVFDLAEVPRGGPKDYTIRIPADGAAEGLALDVVARPEEGDRERIPELSGVAR
jgi:hypothetical protein